MDDYNKPSEQIVFDLIVAATGTSLHEVDVTFGLPRAFVPSQGDPYLRDTCVCITGAPGSSLRGSTHVDYKRLLLSDFIPEFEDIQIKVHKLPFSVFVILEQLNARYGLSLAESDLLDAEFTEYSEFYVVRAHPNSLAWQGTLAFQTSYFERELSELIQIVTLDGFHYVWQERDLAKRTPVVDLPGFVPSNDLTVVTPYVDLPGFDAA